MEIYNKRIDKTLGELLAAASEFAFECSNDDKEAYQMARLAMVEILRRTSQPTDFKEEFDHTATREPQFH